MKNKILNEVINELAKNDGIGSWQEAVAVVKKLKPLPNKKSEGLKFTPSPWRIDGDAILHDEPQVNTTQGIAVSGVATLGDVLITGNRKANGRLIAASPKLLTLVQTAINFTLDDDDVCHQAFLKNANDTISEIFGDKPKLENVKPICSDLSEDEDGVKQGEGFIAVRKSEHAAVRGETKCPKCGQTGHGASACNKY